MGEAQPIVNQILAYYNKTDKRIPLNSNYARTLTRVVGGGARLHLGAFDASGVNCDRWSWDEIRDDLLGVFAMGVEELGH